MYKSYQINLAPILIFSLITCLVTASQAQENTGLVCQAPKLENIPCDAGGQLDVEHYANGQISQIRQDEGGWPGLNVNFNPDRQKTSWASTDTGTTKLGYDNNNQLNQISYANGNQWLLQNDQSGRPSKIDYISPDTTAPISVDLSWRGTKLTSLKHPHENEFLEYNSANLVTQRIVQRQFSDHQLSYSETFVYNQQQQLIEHNLPEGGKLIYDWDGPSLINIDWQDQHQQTHNIIHSRTGFAGYVYGNQIQAQSLAGKQRNVLIFSHNQDMLWGEYRIKQQNLLQKQLITAASHGDTIENHYGYNSRNQTVVIDNYLNANLQHTDWLNWADNGRLINHAKSKIQYDASGLAVAVNDLAINYQAQLRPATILKNNTPIAHYFYNARGHKIRQQYQNHAADRLYLDNQLVAIWQPHLRQRYIYANQAPVGLLQTDASGNTELFYIHANLIGAPVLITDHQQNIVWQADYDYFGKAKVRINKIDLPLRLPGQDMDPVTGWHDNVFRTYNPDIGHYLEPDPLGPQPGLQAYGYARQQPLQYHDPLGLILLAFDGTRYNNKNLGNVWKLAQAYADGPSYYHQGPGNSYYLDWDAVVASSSRQIQENQWQSLLNALTQTDQTSVPIDIIGYSRGAALARDFANKIADHTENGWFSYDDPIRGKIGVCVDLRFLGLFDTVAQFGLLGASNAGYDLGISNTWQWVAHAVASHEFRSLFPLVTVAGGDNANTVEAPFIGAHADIGGGMVLDDDLHTIDNGDLADISLNWMFWQAMAANLNLNNLASADQSVSNPILHDERSTIEKGLLNGDRNIQDANTNTIGPQGNHTTLGNTQREIFEKFINRSENTGTVAGSVDMQAYNKWLQENYGMPGTYH